MDAAVALKTVELRKKTKQRESLLYARAAVNAILTELHANHISFTINGQSYDEELLIMAVQNGPTYGGGFKVAPDARVDDGLLDIVTGGKMSTPKALFCLGKLKSGKYQGIRGFNTYHASELVIQTNKQLPAQVDGEQLMGRHFQVSVQHQAIDFLAPL
jgi:diacylglycerol kinase family enzyme